ncbi:antiviral reverse transcriptase Drt3a [Phocaeicola sp.]|uniref:antiviral reverse transcriptase Drt3a n=1 Tax=Phocaeicola sp. TaxID=2773926 RepID=UPI003AF13387
MAQGYTDFYQFESLWNIMKGEEKRGKLRTDYYSQEVKDISEQLKKLRSKLRNSKKSEQDVIRQDIAELKEDLDGKKEVELRLKALEITKGKAKVEIGTQTIKGHKAYVSKNMDTMLVCQIIKQELRRSYKLHPANMDMIIEQIKGLLDNKMLKIVIRTDIHSFFESISQNELVKKLSDDGFVSRETVKYLKRILYTYNETANILDEKGLPRGLSFSSHLSELYMRPIDERVRRLDGVLFYKRYVDDIFIVADPDKCSMADYWDSINSIFEEKELSLHKDSEKRYLAYFDKQTNNAQFDYLGYKFVYKEGRLDICLSNKRYSKYRIMIDAIFEIYAQCSHYRKKYEAENKDGHSKYCHKDALRQLFERIDILTSNGLLSGRKNFVATGIYYTNKYLTDLSQLNKLDDYLSEKIESKEAFCPPSNLFNYGQDNGYEKNVSLIKYKLHSYSFVKGFNERKIHKSEHFGRILLDLQRIYYSRKG